MMKAQISLPNIQKSGIVVISVGAISTRLPLSTSFLTETLQRGRTIYFPWVFLDMAFLS